MMFTHRCTVCGHAQYQHRGVECQYGWCPAKRHQGEFPLAPELVATFDIKGDVIERIVKPGQSINPGNVQSEVKSCACEACVAAYEAVA